jgi:hypothetical protein
MVLFTVLCFWSGFAETSQDSKDTSASILCDELNDNQETVDHQQIVVITDPRFVSISQYFSQRLNGLPPSSAGR